MRKNEDMYECFLTEEFQRQYRTGQNVQYNQAKGPLPFSKTFDVPCGKVSLPH